MVRTTVAVVGLSACGTEPYETAERGSVRAWVIASAEEGGEALAAGTVRWDSEHSCWVLEPVLDDPSTDPRPARRALVWPEGATVTSDRPPIVTVFIFEVETANEISGAATGYDDPPGGLDIPAPCRPAGVVVINRLDG